MCPDQNQDGFIEEERHQYTDFGSVESQRNDLTAEEFPEGPYGSSKITESLGKSSPWRESQRAQNRFSYENHELHEGLFRDYPAEDDKYVDRVDSDEE